MVLRTVLEPLFMHWPIASGIGSALILLVSAIFKWRDHRVGYKRISLEIHYHLKSRSEITFESLSTIQVVNKNNRTYRTSIHGGREKPQVQSRDPNIHVELDPHPSGGLRRMTVHFDTDVNKGEKLIPLNGSYTDPSMSETPRMPFRLNTRLKELIIAVRLPETERIKRATAEIHKFDGMNLIMRKELFIWQNNLFVHTFHNVKPKRTYELTWEYEDPIEILDTKTVAKRKSIVSK